MAGEHHYVLMQSLSSRARPDRVICARLVTMWLLGYDLNLFKKQYQRLSRWHFQFDVHIRSHKIFDGRSRRRRHVGDE